MPHHKTRGLAAALALGALMAAPSSARALQAEYAPIVVKPNEDTFLRFLVWNQVWTRLIENNPGAPDDWTPDIGLRRSRFLAFGKIGDDALIMFHFGINNQTFLQNEFGARTIDTDAGTFRDPGPNFFIHDAWTEFKIVDADGAFRLDFGGGLLYWNGVSRMNNASTLNFLTVDSPITTWATINGSDQFARQLGLYVKGDIADQLIDYRVAVVRPFANARWGPPNDTFGFSSYVKLQLLEKESNTLPYEVGTYIGKKKVFNIGVGHHWQPGGGSLDPDDGEQGDILLLGADVFADIPFGEKASGGALTAYGLFMLSDYGPNDQVIETGIMPVVNQANANVLNGGGNRYPLLGDGMVLYGQAGYLLPGDFGGLQIQPYVTGQLNLYDAYDDVAPIFEVGSNFYLYGHHAKFTINYRARPIMLDDPMTPGEDGNFDTFASEFILQTMVFL